MANVNINKKVSDPFYRYKMPRIIAKVEGRGNGIKTVIVNIPEISKALQRPPMYPVKFMGIELGAQVSVDSKNDRYIINGAHDGVKLQNSLYDFIEKYLLCPECENPETELITVPKKDKIKIKCIACGNLSFLLHSHKLNTYILKNPPSGSACSVTNAAAANVAGDRGSTDNICVASSTQNGTAAEHDLTAEGSTGECEWFADTSKEAAMQRMNNLTSRVATMTANSDLEKSTTDRLDMFHKFVKEVMKKKSSDATTLLVHESKRLDIEATAVVALSEVIFEDGNILKHLIAHKDLFFKFTDGNLKSQRNLLGAIELVASKHPDKVVSELDKIFKLLVHFELVEDDVLHQWGMKKSRRFIEDSALIERLHAAAVPFFKWLSTAEEESQSEEDASDSEVVFEVTTSSSGKYVPPNIVESSSRTRPPVSTDDGEGDEIDIDDI